MYYPQHSLAGGRDSVSNFGRARGPVSNCVKFCQIVNYHITYSTDTPTKGVTASTHTTYMEAATHMSAAQGGGLETHCHTTTYEHDRVGRVSYSRWRQGRQVGLTKATHRSAREGGASRDSLMRRRDARRTRHHPPVTLISRRLHDTFEQSTRAHDREPIDDYHTTH